MTSFELINKFVNSLDDVGKYIYNSSTNIFDCLDKDIKTNTNVKFSDILRSDIKNLLDKLTSNSNTFLYDQLIIYDMIFNPYLSTRAINLLAWACEKYSNPISFHELIRCLCIKLDLKNYMFFSSNQFATFFMNKMEVVMKVENNKLNFNLHQKLDPSFDESDAKAIVIEKPDFYKNNYRSLGIWGELKTIDFLKKNDTDNIIWISRDYGNGFPGDVLGIKNDHETCYECKAHSNSNLIISVNEFLSMAKGNYNTSFKIHWWHPFGDFSIPDEYEYHHYDYCFTKNGEIFYPVPFNDRNDNKKKILIQEKSIALPKDCIPNIKKLLLNSNEI